MIDQAKPPIVEKAPTNDHGIRVNDALLIHVYQGEYEPVRVIGFSSEGDPVYRESSSKYCVVNLAKGKWKKVGRYVKARRWFKPGWKLEFLEN